MAIFNCYVSSPEATRIVSEFGIAISSSQIRELWTDSARFCQDEDNSPNHALQVGNWAGHEKTLWGPSFHYVGVSENVVYPIVPNGFADQIIPFLNG